MHREIQIKQFPIVTTHWWPKTRNERFVWENEQYLYRFYLLYTTMSKWSECAHASGVWRVCARSGLCLCKHRKAPEVTRAFKGGSEHLGGMRARTQITWTWLCTRGKNDINTVRLGHQCVVTMGNCLIWISLCMFFFPLIETVTYTCHYMTDRLERFDLKTSKLDLLKKKRHLHLGCPWGKLIDTKF